MINQNGNMNDIEAGGDVLSLIRKFAAAHHFRSATPDELELRDFYRRPLRPEDLEFIDFTVPVASDTVCDLPSLASQRILRCIYDLQMVRLPEKGSPQVFEQRALFYNDSVRIAAARLTPFLERFAFGFLDGLGGEARGNQEASPEKLREKFECCLSDAKDLAQSTRTRFLHGDFSKPGLRFFLVQNWCLGQVKAATLDRARTCGYFDLLPRSLWPQNRFHAEENSGLARLAGEMEVHREPHTFWQFYLPTWLAKANYLSALAGRPELSLAFIGASFAAEAEWDSVARLLRQMCHGSGQVQATKSDEADGADGILQRFMGAVAAVDKALGVRGLEEFSRGLTAAVRLAQLARTDLEAQLRWLASVEDYVEVAHRIDQRIQSERPNIDRETFVEPREMCSTTHVHNDHRLVVIESGDMVFWGRPGMQFRMSSGDMILVPRGRLHGSTVESPQCIYHQPIIPHEWVSPLIAEVDQRHGWVTQTR